MENDLVYKSVVITAGVLVVVLSAARLFAH